MVQLEVALRHVVLHAPELQLEITAEVAVAVHLVMVETVEVNVVPPVHRTAEPRLRILIMVEDRVHHVEVHAELLIPEDHARQGVHHHAQLMEQVHHVRVTVARPDARRIAPLNVQQLVETDAIHHVDQVVI